jgi:phosphoribosylanthranilate isomerase
MPVRVKICGVTTVEDALCCVDAGADYVGLNFCSRSKRFVDLDRASEIARRLPSSVGKVGVFVDAARSEIERAVAAASLDVIQLHGHETPPECRGFPVPVIKAIRVAAGAEPPAAAAAHFAVDYVLLDGDAGAELGGSARSFDWRLAVGVAPGRLFLAGGLDPDNVAAAVRIARPFAVDVASGVETSPRRKDPVRVREFIEHAKHA